MYLRRQITDNVEVGLPKNSSIVHIQDLQSLDKLWEAVEEFQVEFNWNKMWGPEDIGRRTSLGWKLYILYIDGTVGGWVWLDTASGSICNLYVKKGYRNQGYGSRLIKYALKVSLDIGKTSAYCYSESWNQDGIRAFKANGFVEINGPFKLCIVAHPDDEIIFAGASLIERPYDWHVICVTNGTNEIRKKEFHTVMQHVGCSHEIWDFKDVWKKELPVEKISEKLSKVFEDEWSLVLTHDPRGDTGYEHHHHAEVFTSVLNTIPDKSKLYCFSYLNDISKRSIKEKSRALNLYRSQTEKYGFIYIPLLEDYFYRESYIGYNDYLKNESDNCRY